MSDTERNLAGHWQTSAGSKMTGRSGMPVLSAARFGLLSPAESVEVYEEGSTIAA
jgi:hypothetical protein